MVLFCEFCPSSKKKFLSDYFQPITININRLLARNLHEIMKIFDELHRNGNTIILVTHEDDIAKYSNRIVRLLDGKIVKDEIVVKN